MLPRSDDGVCRCSKPTPIGPLAGRDFCAICGGIIPDDRAPRMDGGRLLIPRPKRFDATGKVVDA